MDFNAIAMAKKYKRRPMRIAMERFYNLNCKAQEKFDQADRNVAKWTVFINKTHTIAHVVPKGGNMWVRVKLGKGLKKEADGMVECFLYARLAPYLLGV